MHPSNLSYVQVITLDLNLSMQTNKQTNVEVIGAQVEACLQKTPPPPNPIIVVTYELHLVEHKNTQR